LEGLELVFIKIAGYEFSDLPLLQAVAKTGKPVIASAAMASVKILPGQLRLYGKRLFAAAILHCINAYPANPMHEYFDDHRYY
jgi:N-acetylneuraminate synthase